MQGKARPTVRQGVHPVLVQAHGDGVHLGLALCLLHLPALLGKSALHHGGLGQGAVRVLGGAESVTGGLTCRP